MDMIRYLAFCITFFLFCAGTAYGQQGPAVIKGRITTSNGLPAERVSVMIAGTGLGTQSGEDGAYRMETNMSGDLTITISALGMGEQSKGVHVVPGREHTVDFSIDITSQQLEEVLVSKVRGGYNMQLPSPTLRLDEPLIEIPQNIQVVSGKMLVDQQVISMGDGLIRNVSGAVRLEHWGNLYTNISMRGSQIQAFRNGFNVVASYWG